MPNRYEREIEEILRNLDGGEPKSSRGPRSGERSRRKPSTRQRSRGLSLHLRVVDVFLIIALGAALFGGGYAYAQGGPDPLTGILAIIGIVCLLCMVITPFLSRASAPPSRYTVTPLSRNPLSNLATRWNLFMLKWRYRRRRDH